METDTKPLAEMGSVSSGTLLTRDLLQAFNDTLRSLDALHELIDECDAMLDDEWCDNYEARSIDLVNEDLPDALQAYAPPFCYFGAHPGDGADFGFWFDNEAFETAVDGGEIVKVETAPSYAAVISDHGNIELYECKLENVLGIV